MCTQAHYIDMATRHLSLPFRIPMGPLAASMSLPLELKTLLNEFGNTFWQFNIREFVQILSANITPSSDLVDVVYSQLKQHPSDWPNCSEETPFHQPLLDSLNNFINTLAEIRDCDRSVIIKY